ncbi:MAG: hypothetical protein HRU41_09915 [Saprospiraceae bacterium]|nr:hypothetical protein [Saprospiraceae bacterium]
MQRLIVISILGLSFLFIGCHSTKSTASSTTDLTNDLQLEAINKIVQLTNKNICNPYWLEDPAWDSFLQKIKTEAPSNESVETFARRFNRAARALPFTHFYLINTNRKKSSGKRLPAFELKKLNEQTVQLIIRSFVSNAPAMAKLVQQIKTEGYEKLIIDLRNNTGGTLDAAVVLGQFLTADAIDAGVYLSRQWYQEHDKHPSSAQINGLKYLQDMSAQGFYKLLRKEKGFRMVLPPHQEEVFGGEVVVLTNNNTGSTCEALVHHLKKIKKGTIVGEKTAGAMLTGSFFKVNEDLKLFIPVADYITAEGNRIDKVGVLPDIEVPSKEALQYAMTNLLQD